MLMRPCTERQRLAWCSFVHVHARLIATTLRRSRAPRAMRGPPPVAALALAVAAAPAAHADLVAKINGLRKNECAARPAGAPLHVDDTAADVAHELARGHKLADALKRAGYPASTATSLHVKGAQGEDGVRSELAAHYCSAVGDARYSEVGVFRSGDEYWIVLASRKFKPPPLDPGRHGRARARARECGARRRARLRRGASLRGRPAGRRFADARRGRARAFA